AGAGARKPTGTGDIPRRPRLYRVGTCVEKKSEKRAKKKKTTNKSAEKRRVQEKYRHSRRHAEASSIDCVGVASGAFIAPSSRKNPPAGPPRPARYPRAGCPPAAAPSPSARSPSPGRCPANAPRRGAAARALVGS